MQFIELHHARKRKFHMAPSLSYETTNCYNNYYKRYKNPFATLFTNIVYTRMTCTYCLYTVYIVSKIVQLTTTELHSVNKIDVKLIK